jgi:hypothetical protein
VSHIADGTQYVELELWSTAFMCFVDHCSPAILPNEAMWHDCLAGNSQGKADLHI